MSANVRVCARVRPLPPNADGASILEVEGGSEASVRVAKDGCAKHFFTRVYDARSTQEDLFGSVGAPAVDEVLEGFHAAVIVYGQTASGKTYTLGCTDGGKEGIQPRAIRYLFSRISELGSEACRITVQAEYVQVYKENIVDLIDPAKDRVDLPLDPVHGVSLSGNTKVAVASGDQFLSLVARGDRSRQTASTSLNAASSRSHACLVVTVRRAVLRGGREVSASEGRLHLVDLAGSDRADKAGAQSEAYRETVAINKSLTVLGSCVHGVVTGQKVIPFRESKLTRLLQHCLSGNGRTTVVVTLHPAESQLNETTRTLQFGARSMREQAAVTVDDCRGELEELRLALAQQQERHAALRAECAVEERSLVEVQAGCDGVDARLKASEVRALTETDAVRTSMHAAYADKLVRYGEQLEMQKRKIGAAIQDLRENNKGRIEAAEQHRGEKLSLVQEETQRQKEAVDEKLAELQARLDELEEQAARRTADLPDEQALKEELRQSRAELDEMKTRIRECTPSPYEGYSLLELRRTLRKVRRRNASLRNKSRDLTMLRDDQVYTKNTANLYTPPTPLAYTIHNPQARTSKFVESKGGFSEQPSMRYADDDVASDESIVCPIHTPFLQLPSTPPPSALHTHTHTHTHRPPAPSPRRPSAASPTLPPPAPPPARAKSRASAKTTSRPKRSWTAST